MNIFPRQDNKEISISSITNRSYCLTRKTNATKNNNHKNTISNRENINMRKKKERNSHHDTFKRCHSKCIQSEYQNHVAAKY
jgi:hypothetical protein